MAPESDTLITCWECSPPTEWTVPQMRGHVNKHRNEAKKAAQAVDSSSTSPADRVDEKGEVKPPPDGAEYNPPQVTPVIVHRPKVADGLVPWLSLVGLAVHRRNNYDGDVMSQGIPGLVSALDDVAQTNDSLYRLLEGIKKGDSPNFRLAMAVIAIVVPILANHRPDSGLLRNAVGGLRIMPGTNIPPLPKPANVTPEQHAQTEGMVGQMRDLLDNMSEEDAQAMTDAIAQMPPDLIEKMVDFQTNPAMMDHPEDNVSDEQVIVDEWNASPTGD